MRFWDASAIVPLLIAAASTRRLQAFAAKDPDMLVWWGSEVEGVSALARLERDAALDPQAAVLAFNRLKQLAAGRRRKTRGATISPRPPRFLAVFG